MEDFPRCHRLELPRARKSCSPADSPVWRAPIMRTGTPVFAQVTGFLPMHALRCCSERYDGNRHVRRFSCHGQFRSMAFAQLTAIEPARQGRQASAHWLRSIRLRARPSRSAPCGRTCSLTVVAPKSRLRSDILGRVSSCVNLRRLNTTARPSLAPTHLLRDRRPVPDPNARQTRALAACVDRKRAFPCTTLWRIRTSCGGSCGSIGQLRSRQSGSGPMNLDATGTHGSRLTTWPFRR